LAASFVYDAFGRRMNKDINGSVSQFLYDGLNPVQELDGANPANVTANLLTGLNIDEYFTRADSNGAMNFIADAMGSTLALTDSSGAINTSYTYEPFGNTSIAGTSANPYQFTGRENDGTGLYFYRARYYSSMSQRFISQDPLDFAGGGPNFYAYVGNTPELFRDPFGLYFDLNFGGGYWAGVTFGLQFWNGEAYWYVGPEATTPGFSLSGTCGIGAPTPGWQLGLQMQALYAQQIGITSGNDLFHGLFAEIGYAIGYPGLSLSGYYLSANPLFSVPTWLQSRLPKCSCQE